ncbi:ABC transporter ATP-binding protein [Paenibacillus sp. strain BS8-2]
MARQTGIARLMQIAGEKRGLLVAAGLSGAISAVAMLVPYTAVYMILRELLVHAADLTQVDKGLMIRWGIIALIAMLAALLLLYISGLTAHIAAFRILYGLRVKLSERIGKLPLGWLNRTSTGAVKKTLEQNVEKIESFIAHQLPDLIQVLVKVVLMIGVMLYLNVWLALACMVPNVLGFVLQIMMTSGPERGENIKKYYDSLERMNSSAVQYVRGMPSVKVFGQSVYSFRKFYADMVDYRDYCIKNTDQFQNGYLLFKIVLGSIATFVLPVGVFLLSRDTDSIAFASVLLFFLIMAPGISAPMYKIMHLLSSIRDIDEGVKRIDLIFAEQPVAEAAKPQKPKQYEVTFDGVTFSYDGEGSDRKALSAVSFIARQGEVTAMVGPSGAGKSTIANLVPRFWDVQEGAIRIGGVDVRDIATDELMNTVAFVFQDTFLFYDSVYHNIAVGRPDASQEEVIAAARAAQCHGFISALPNGYETLIGEGGVYLSGGEEQRIAVARAILKNSPILVLDEATAFADPENEYEMQLAIGELMRGKTVLVIAHRLQTITDANQILVFNEGMLLESGKHQALLALNGLYARMWRAYTDADQWEMALSNREEVKR